MGGKGVLSLVDDIDFPDDVSAALDKLIEDHEKNSKVEMWRKICSMTSLHGMLTSVFTAS